MFFQSFTEVDETLAARQPLYVRNVHRTRGGIRSVLTVNYPTAEGPKAFNIPATQVAFDLCQFVDPESLRGSDSFRKFLNKGAIVVVPEAEALAEMRQRENAEIFRVAYEDANNTYVARADEAKKEQSAGSAARDERHREQSGAMRGLITSLDPTLAKALNLVTSTGQQPDPKMLVANPRFASLEARIHGLSSEDVIHELRRMASDLSTADLQAIQAGSQWPAAAKEWAAARLRPAARAS
jgi:hypothetical protein